MKRILVEPRRGGMLLEVLVAMLLSAFALLGFAAIQARASNAEFEALQRSQALVLIDDMVARLNANRAQAGSYVVADLIGAGALENCAGAADTAARDLCEWANLLRGAAEVRGGSRVGAMVSARGCITRAAGSSDRYTISVAWMGVLPTAAPTATCGSDAADVYPDAALRRAASATVCIALLRDPAVAAAVPRC
jgi:type IV pilus assembly protein PilV